MEIGGEVLVENVEQDIGNNGDRIILTYIMPKLQDIKIGRVNGLKL